MILTSVRVRVVSFALLLTAVLGTGCVHLEQTIEITKKGAVVVDYRFSVAEDALDTVATGRKVIQEWQGGRPGSDALDANWFFSRKAVNSYFVGKGVSVKDYKVYSKNGRRHAEISVLARYGLRELNGGRFGDYAVEFTKDGNVRFHADLVEDLDGAKMPPDERRRMRAFCDDLFLKLIVKTPTKVLATSAPSRRRRSAAWVFDPGQDDSFLRRTPVIDLVFSGEELNWVPKPKPKESPPEKVVPEKEPAAKKEAPPPVPSPTPSPAATEPKTVAPRAATEPSPDPQPAPASPQTPPQREKPRRNPRWKWDLSLEGVEG